MISGELCTVAMCCVLCLYNYNIIYLIGLNNLSGLNLSILAVKFEPVMNFTTILYAVQMFNDKDNAR